VYVLVAASEGSTTENAASDSCWTLEVRRATQLNASMEVTPGLRDILATNLRVVFCGINPGLKSAVLGHHFAGRGNRFWKTIYLAGFTPEEITPEDGESILVHRCGLTTAVDRATSRAGSICWKVSSFSAVLKIIFVTIANDGTIDD
jgi:mismatch-specific thymine-DNA glycosylase